MGLLCVVSDAEGLPENVLHGETGWVVSKRCPPKLATQLIHILDSPSEMLENIRTQVWKE
ncbi:MAG: hypothetical protein H6564_20955 [Lewinellaceae bacterium]|nr:hypothetical protein [Lewinellaceae bacterium]